MKYKKTLKAFLSPQYLHFFSVQPQLSVELAAASDSSLNFTWNEYQHCNNDSALVMYEFELRRNDDNTIVHSGENESNTMISFNNLESATEYVFQVRVSLTDYLIGSSRFSSWSSNTYGMTTLLTSSTKAPTTTEFGTNHSVLKYSRVNNTIISDNSKT